MGAGSSSRPDSNARVDFKGRKRRNKTHRSATDPEARLYTKSDGQAALLSHSMHVLTENRHGIGVDIRVGKADGYAERTCCLKMLDRVKRTLGLEPATLGADHSGISVTGRYSTNPHSSPVAWASSASSCSLR